jgi:DNA-binding Lrp family transcriptional regulator
MIRPKWTGDGGIMCGARSPAPTPEKPMSEPVKLDRIDINILAHLQRNGRITNVELAEAVALSPSPCLIRVKRLEKAGYIVGYNAHIDIAKLGETVTVFTQVTLTDHHMEDFARFEAGIRTVDEVIECHLISGGYDYLLKFMTRGIAHYQSLIEEILERNIGITKYFSYIVIKSPIVKMYYPLMKLYGQQHQK